MRHLPRLPFIGFIVVSAAVIGIVVTANAFAGADTHSRQSVNVPPGNIHGKGTPNPYPPGVPAISPRFKTTSNTMATFTESDVVHFVKTHGFPGGTLVSSAHLTILMVRFVTAKEASVLMNGERVDRPDNTLVCYVRVKGPFFMEDMSVPAGLSVPTAQIGEIVFDGQTGNLLGWGALELSYPK